MDGFSKEFVKLCADELGMQKLDEDSIKCIADDVSFKQSVKLMRCCKRKRLIPHDIDGAMKLYNVQPTYGFRGKEWVPFRRSGPTNAGRDVITADDKDIDLDDFIAQEVPKLPPNIYVKAHWLSINGTQPQIPENPQLSSEEDDVINFAVPGRVILEARNNAFQDITVEQQVYFKESTEACVCAEENRRKEALASLSSDPGLQPLVPRLVAFLSEGVKLNVAQQHYVQLIYLMRMLRSLVENPHLSVDSYIHELLPACASCCMSRQLCQRPKEDNHWALRTFAARQLSYLVRKYTTETNQVHSRVVKLALRVLQDQSSALVSCFGAIAIIGELGEEVVRSTLLPFVRTFGERIRVAEEVAHQQNPLEQLTIKKINEQLALVLCPVVKNMMQPPDHMSDYQAKFGYFAHLLLTGVHKERQAHPPPVSITGAAITPYAQQLQQYQAQKQQVQRRQSTSTVPAHPPQKLMMMQHPPPKAESVTTPIFHSHLGPATSLPARSPGPGTPSYVLGGARFQTVTRPIHQMPSNQPTPSNSPGPQQGQITVRLVGSQQPQAPK